MGRVAWTVYDPVDDVTYSLPINPLEGGSPQRRKQYTAKGPAAPGAPAVVFEGNAGVLEFSVEGTILTQTHFEMLDELFDKPRQLLLTDDLGREFWVWIVEWSPRRKRSARFPWRHDYTLRYVEVDGG